MNEAFEDALVHGWEILQDSLDLPDPDDNHVLAAAILGRADAIITNNIRDFPSSVVGKYGLEAINVDDFLLHQLELSTCSTLTALKIQARAMRNPKIAVTELLSRLEKAGAPKFAQAVRTQLTELHETGVVTERGDPSFPA